LLKQAVTLVLRTISADTIGASIVCLAALDHDNKATGRRRDDHTFLA